jgi:hypothetical protein
MQYLLMIATRKFRDDLTEEDRRPWIAYRQAMMDAGVYVGGAPLKPPATGKTIWKEGGKHRVHDGPFAESKEQLGGYILLDVPSQEEALEWAARCPAADYGRIEVRPLDLDNG